MQEFFKFLFYGALIILLFRYLVLLSTLNSYSEKRRLIKEYFKSIKEKKEKFDFKICPEHIKSSIIYGGVFGIFEIFLMLFGLLTFNWLLFIIMLLYSILTGMLIKVMYKFRTAYKIIIFADSIVTILVYTLAILNSYHFKIEFIKFL